MDIANIVVHPDNYADQMMINIDGNVNVREGFDKRVHRAMASEVTFDDPNTQAAYEQGMRDAFLKMLRHPEVVAEIQAIAGTPVAARPKAPEAKMKSTTPATPPKNQGTPDPNNQTS